MASSLNMQNIRSDFDSDSAAWHYLERCLDRIMFEPTWGTDIPSLVGLYTVVHNYCTSQQAVENTTAPPHASPRGAHLSGGNLYRSLDIYLHQYLVKLEQHMRSFPKQNLLARYFEESVHYANAAQIINYVFRYLNRHWIKREIDEGRGGIYEINTLHLVLWQSEVLSSMHEVLIDALVELVENHRKNDNMESDEDGRVQHLLKLIDSLLPTTDGDSIEISGSIRSFYGSLLEYPWRAAIEASCTDSPPVFLYPTPFSATARIGGKKCADLAEQLDFLMLRSSFEGSVANSNSGSGIVTLVTGDEIIETDQRTADCSFLLKRLCAYFGPDIIAREVIPVSNVSGPVLRKVLEWCEHHKNDANIGSAGDDGDSHRSWYTDVGAWDQKYFQVDQEILFEIISAANYLDIGLLCNAGCIMVANMIKGKSPEEIRKAFNITNSFTPEEEEQVRREKEWAEDR